MVVELGGVLPAQSESDNTAGIWWHPDVDVVGMGAPRAPWVKDLTRCLESAL